MYKKILIIIFISFQLFIASCTKKSAKKHEGNYNFIVVKSIFSFSSGSTTDTIYFSGSIEATYRKTLIIEYESQNIIYPKVDAEGNLTYTEWEEKDPHNNFFGKFDKNGDVDIEYEVRGLGGGWSDRIHGSKAD